MANVDPNLRKAAVLLRSLDADTAAVMLGHLSAEEAATIRAAMRAVGQVATEEQTDVMAELRDARPQKQNAHGGVDVELALSTAFKSEPYDERVTMPNVGETAGTTSKRFEFLENAPIHALVPHLAREHAQTIAVVLSHLAPRRAAAVLAELPKTARAETIERLSTLGETDPECVTVLERELAGWAAKRDSLRAQGRNRRDTMSAILAAADAKSRNQILGSMRDHKAAVRGQFDSTKAVEVRPNASRHEPRQAARAADIHASQTREQCRQKSDSTTGYPAALCTETPLPTIAFDDLNHLDSRTLSAVLRQVDANVLALALAGSREELIDRICEQMPKRTARAFRRELRRLGPTRLSDVEAAQHAVANVAARQLAERRTELAAT